MKKIIILFAWILSYRVKIKLSDIKLVIDEDLNIGDGFDYENVLEWSTQQLRTKEEIKSGGYKEGPEYEIPMITRNNVLLDGTHRISVLKDISDPNKVISVKKVWMLTHKQIFWLTKKEWKNRKTKFEGDV